MHTVDRAILITDKDVLIKVIEGCEYCVGSRSWVKIRSEYITNSAGGQLLKDNPSEIIDDNEIAAYRLAQLQREIMTVIEYLEPRYSEQFFGFHKKQRRYICLYCLSVRQQDSFFEYKYMEEVWLNTAQVGLEHQDIVHCIICEGNYLIKREKCVFCDNDVIDAHNGLCLSCTSSIPKDAELQTSRKVV
jgi:hypothetical protein